MSRTKTSSFFKKHPLAFAVGSALSVMSAYSFSEEVLESTTTASETSNTAYETNDKAVFEHETTNTTAYDSTNSETHIIENQADHSALLPEIKIVDENNATYTTDKISNPKVTQKLVDTPKTVNVVTEQLLNDQGSTTLEEALRNVSGVSTFGAGEGGGGNVTTGDAITIRGFSANGSIYSDGIRDVAGYSRDTFNTEQIEVAKGSSSTLTGKGSAGGSVNLVTKTASTEADLTSLQATLDDLNSLRLSADFNKVIDEQSAVRVNILTQKQKSPHGNNDEKYKTISAAISYIDQINAQTDIIVNALYVNQDNTPVLGLPFVSEEVAAQTGLKEGPLAQDNWNNSYVVAGRDYETVDAANITLVINHDINEKWDLRSQSRIGESSRESITARPTFINSGTRDEPIYDGSLTTTSTRNEFSDNQLFVTQLDMIGEVFTGNIQHDIVSGFEVYKESKQSPTLDLSSLVLNSDTYNLNNPSYTGATGRISADIDTNGLALYVLDTVTFNDKLQVSAGLRYEHFVVDGYQTSRGARVNANAQADLTSWNFAINFKPTISSSVYASIANAQEPQGSELSVSGRTDEQTQEYATLDPLESITAEIGTKWEFFEQKLIVGAAIFDTTKDVYDTDDEGNITTSGESHNIGIELNVSGQINEQLNISASYTNQDAEVTEDAPSTSGTTNEGNGLTAAPDESGNVWISYNENALTFGAGAQYTSGNTYWRQQRAYFETGNTTLVSAMAAYEVNDQLNVQLNIENLFDEAYITDYSARGHFLPGAPRVIKLSVNYDF